MPRKRERPIPIEAELVPDPPPQEPALPDEMPSYDAGTAPAVEGNLHSIDGPPSNGWKKPGLGVQLNTETMRELQDAFPPSRVVAMMEQMATAMMETKSGILRPDYRAREQVIKIMLSYSLGLPVPQAPVPDPPPKESNEQTMDRLLASPAARRMLLDAIHRAEAETGKGPAEKD